MCVLGMLSSPLFFVTTTMSSSSRCRFLWNLNLLPHLYKYDLSPGMINLLTASSLQV